MSETMKRFLHATMPLASTKGIVGRGTMLDTVDAALAQVSAEAEDEIALPDGATSLDFIQAIYRSPAQPMTRRMRAAVAALPFEHPKLSVNANANLNFASEMEEFARAIGKSNVIDAKANYRTDTRRLAQPEPIETDPSKGGFRRRL